MRQRLNRLSVAAVMLLANGACIAQTYDSRTGSYSMPGSPISPTSPMQCDALQQEWSSLSQSLDNAHQSCLDAHQREPADPRASAAPSDPICSHSACQSLHNARAEVTQRAADRVQACRADVALFQRNQQLANAQLDATRRRQQFQAQAMSQAAQDAAQRQVAQAQQAQQTQQIDQARLAAAQQAADVLAQRTDAAQFNPSVPDVAPGGEFASDSPFANSSPNEVSLDTGTSAVQLGNPPNNIAGNWQAGSASTRADGAYDRYVYVWQFVAPDAGLCPSATNDNGDSGRQALYQETAIDHFQVANGTVTTANLQKSRVFLRCLSPGATSGYPKYQTFPDHRLAPQTAASGVRG